LSSLFCRKAIDKMEHTSLQASNPVPFTTNTLDNISFTDMTCFPLQFSRLAPTSPRRSDAPVRSGPPLETATVPPREIRMDRQRRRQSSLSAMNAGDQACPETRPCLRPSPGGRKPARTLAGRADGTDVLLENVESQHRHAAHLDTHANPYIERLIGSIRRECLDHIIVLDETGLRRVLKEYFEYYERCRTHLSLDKDAPVTRPIQPPAHGHVVEIAQVGGLHHLYTREAA